MINYFKNYCLVLLLLFPLGVIFSQSTASERYAQINAFEEIDEHVRDCPKEIKSDPDQLVEYFNQVAKTDLEKARSIYVWLSDNISYNVKAINKSKFGDNSAEGVLKSKNAVCAGYAALFDFLGKKMNLEIREVAGYSKNSPVEQNWYFIDEEPGHAWNAIKINGLWKVFDATWGAGSAADDKRGKLVFTKEYTDNWFNLSPHEAIFSHFPQDASMMFIEEKISLEEYEEFPTIDISAFTSGLLDAHDTFIKSKKKSNLKLPVVYYINPMEIQVIQAPTEFRMKRRKIHFFEFFSDDLKNIYLYKNEEPFQKFNFDPKSNRFSLEFTSKEEAKIVIVTENLKGELFSIIQYDHN